MFAWWNGSWTDPNVTPHGGADHRGFRTGPVAERWFAMRSPGGKRAPADGAGYAAPDTGFAAAGSAAGGAE